MEITPFLIYCIGITESLSNAAHFCVWFSIVAMIFLIVPVSIALMDEEGCSKEFANIIRKALKTSVITFVLSSTLYVFLPSQKTIVAMIAVPAVVNNERIQNISSDLLKWAERYVRELANPKRIH